MGMATGSENPYPSCLVRVKQAIRNINYPENREILADPKLSHVIKGSSGTLRPKGHVLVDLPNNVSRTIQTQGSTYCSRHEDRATTPGGPGQVVSKGMGVENERPDQREEGCWEGSSRVG
jgi:hypothetical protein